MTSTSRTHRHMRHRGFTLLEVLLVLAILGVIAAMVVPNLLGRQQEANIKVTKLTIKNFEDAVKLYAVDHDGAYPEGDAETVMTLLMSNVNEETGEAVQPYIEEVPLDAWKNPMQYEYPPSGNRQPASLKPAVWSFGPDGQDGTDDDINNWDEQLQM